MKPVDLLYCQRCKLIWVKDTELVQKRCPSCLREYTVPQAPVVVAGQQVPVKSLMVFDSTDGLLDRAVRHGLDVLKLGDRCPHGFVARVMCPNC
jgi:hypothetical protein